MERVGLVTDMCVTRPAARNPVPAIHDARMASASRETAGWDDRDDRDVRGDGCDRWMRLGMNLQVAGPFSAVLPGKRRSAARGDGRPQGACRVGGAGRIPPDGPGAGVLGTPAAP